jgi:Ca-activated chloride channel family protein
MGCIYAFFIAPASHCCQFTMIPPLISRFSGAALVALFSLSGLEAQQLAPATFRTSAQMVLVPVSVTDHDGRTIEGLRPQDFSVFDDQTPRQIASFTSEDSPCSIGLVLDVSGSMRNALGTAKNVARAFFKAANPDDEFLLLTVSSAPGAAPEFTTDTETLERQLQATAAGGMTALIDTLYLGLRRMREAKQPRRALLILSDGMENYSRYSKGDLMRLAQEADVQVYTILVDGLGGAYASTIPFRPSMIAKPGDMAAARQGPTMLEELSDKTGGLHFHVRGESDATDAAARAGRALRNEYIIGYHPPDSPLAGKFHHVRVKANVPRVRVYARNGYYSQ